MVSRKVLVLNADYRAISVCSVAKAFLLVYLQKAETVNTVQGGFIQTVNKAFAAPSVIRLNSYINIPYRGVMLTRQNIFKRDGNQCVYCNSTKDLTLDHVVPRSQGGKTSWTNLVSACQRCNAKKSDFSLEDVGMTLPYKPFKPTFVMFLREFSRMGDENWKPYLQHA
ncbi:HNH endonuclease [Bernardetia sp.]|uniref:HNH endonuclease n=1 Tax=Bernardetia sp. TaxID=1937974 RepID=UPI0025C02B5C|nr:HNH endonuclease [Bernardetia sp.]